jgi:hypothetical protein
VSAFAAFLASACGAVFLAAGLAKLRPPASMPGFLLATGVPPGLAVPVVRALPAVEGSLGVALIAGVLPGPASLLAAALALGFVGVLLAARLRGVAQGCACFGFMDGERSSIAALLRATGLAAALLALVALQLPRPGSWTFVPRSLDAGAVLLGVLTGLAYVGVFALLVQVVAFSRERSALRPDV